MKELQEHPCADVRRLRLRSAGMFSNVNEVVEQLRLAQLGAYCFVVDWQKSPYRDASRSEDPWLYYFEPCFPDVTLPGQAPDLPGGPPIACTIKNIITPRLRDGVCNPLLLPRDRQAAKMLIDAHVRIRPEVQSIVDDFAREHFSGKIIGLHVRGPGRTDGGVPELRQKYGDPNKVPLAPFIEATEKYFDIFPCARVFACSDSSEVIDGLVRHFGSRLILYEATRSAFGEMHAGHPKNDGLSFPPLKLGMDVLVEACLLAQADILVHGNSNVANFVLCRNSGLKHHYVAA